MKNLNPSVLNDIENVSWILAKQAQDYYYAWKSGAVYIPRAALVAMAKRYHSLRDRDDLSLLEVYEFGRLYAFFSLVYPIDNEPPSPAQSAIEFCNLLNAGLPISEQ